MSYDVTILIVCYAGIQVTFWNHDYFDKLKNQEPCLISQMERISSRRKRLNIFCLNILTHNLSLSSHLLSLQADSKA